MRDKNWVFSMNQNPLDQSTLQKQCQSFLYQLKNHLKSIGWTIAFGVNNRVMNLPVGLTNHSCIKLADGRLLLMGGQLNGSTYQNVIYFGTLLGGAGTKGKITWVKSASVLPQTLAEHTCTLLSDGRVLVTGGNNGGTAQNTVYFGTVSGNLINWETSLNTLPVALYGHTLVAVSDSVFLVIGGHNGTAAQTAIYFGNLTIAVPSATAPYSLVPATTTIIPWTTSTSVLPLGLVNHTCTKIDDSLYVGGGDYGSRVFIAGGNVTAGTAQQASYFGVVNTSASTIALTTLAGANLLPYAITGHTCQQLDDGRLVVVGGNTTANATPQTTVYFGTLSGVGGNNLTWVAGTVLMTATGNHAMPLMMNDQLLVLGGMNSYNLVFFGNIVGNTINWFNTESGSSDTWDSDLPIGWNTNGSPHSYMVLTSPAGFVPGPLGTYAGEQSKMSICIEALGGHPADYSKLNMVFYKGIPNLTTATKEYCPSGGQSINPAGMTFINPAMTPCRFHFAGTIPKTVPADGDTPGGFHAVISYNGTGIMSSVLYALPMADVQTWTYPDLSSPNLDTLDPADFNTKTTDYPYAAIMGLYYGNTIQNMSSSVVFDAVSNSSGGVKLFAPDGSNGIAREMHLSTTAGGVVPGTGTIAGSGDLNGKMLEFPLYIYNASAGKVGMVGRLPDIYGLGGTALTNGSVTPAIGTIQQSIIYQVSLPANTGFLA